MNAKRKTEQPKEAESRVKLDPLAVADTECGYGIAIGDGVGIGAGLIGNADSWMTAPNDGPKITKFDPVTPLLDDLHVEVRKINDTGLKCLLDYARFLANERPREPRDGYGKVIPISGWQRKPLSGTVCGAQETRS